MRKIICLLSPFLFIVACASSFQIKMQSLQPGMEREKVIEILGRPDTTKTKGSEEVLRYPDGIVFLENGRFTHSVSTQLPSSVKEP